MRYTTNVSTPVWDWLHIWICLSLQLLRRGKDLSSLFSFSWLYAEFSGWKKFVVKLRMLFAFPWERARKGSVLTMKLRGQDSLFRKFVRISIKQRMILASLEFISTLSLWIVDGPKLKKLRDI